jgi:zinc transporter
MVDTAQVGSEERARMILLLPAYGADSTGLVCGFLFAPGMPGRSLTSPEALAWLRSPRGAADPEFAWPHFDLAGNATEKWLREHLALPDAFHEALHEGTRSTRVEYADGSLVGVINDVLFDFSFGASDISILWLCVGPRTVISARRKPLRSIDRLRASVRQGVPFRSAFEILVRLMRDQGDVLVQIVRDATSRVDRIEDSLLAERLAVRRVDLGALRRVLVRLQRLRAPEPAALFRLLNRPPEWVAEPDVQELRQATEEFSVALNDTSALLERVKLLQEEIASELNRQNNRSLFLLTVFTVLALPINIIAGLFGMNVGGIPLNQDDHGFWTIVGVVAAFTAPTLWIVLRRRND